MKLAFIGGHLAPALAVLDALPKDINPIFIGRKSSLEGDQSPSLEYTTISKIGIPFIPLTAGRIQRKFTKYTLLSLLKIPYGIMQAILILKKHRPDAVISFGGYLSVPVGLAANFLGIPLIIHEQTLRAGLANKLLSRFAVKICISWQHSARFFPKEKIILTGNPVRKFSTLPTVYRFESGHREAGYTQLSIPKGHLPLVYITGGSAGAHAINVLVEGCLKNLLDKCRIIHQTGSATQYNDFERLTQLRGILSQKLRERYLLAKFVEPYDVGVLMDAADLIVSRSGINTITELLYFGKPCLLIPLPYGQRQEQLNNARFIKKIGIGDYVIQAELTTYRFLAMIENMLEKLSKYSVFTQDAKSLIRTDAAERITRVIYETVSKKQEK